MQTTALRYFLAVAREGTIAAASNRLNVAPSAISRQIANLEAELACLLFERRPRGMVLSQAGELLAREGFVFDIAYTSVLKRAIRTLWIALDAMDLMWLPVVHSWRLNERHYGALQGLNKAETAKKFGDEQVLVWRRSYDTPPPALTADDARCERSDPRYAGLAAGEVPLTECLKDTVARVLPLWNETLAPAIRSGQRLVIAAHGNSIRALVKYLDGISDAEIAGLNIPTGIPLSYELDAEFKPLNPGGTYLDPEAAAAAIEAVKNQGKKKQ